MVAVVALALVFGLEPAWHFLHSPIEKEYFFTRHAWREEYQQELTSGAEQGLVLADLMGVVGSGRAFAGLQRWGKIITVLVFVAVGCFWLTTRWWLGPAAALIMMVWSFNNRLALQLRGYDDASASYRRLGWRVLNGLTSLVKAAVAWGALRLLWFGDDAVRDGQVWRGIGIVLLGTLVLRAAHLPNRYLVRLLTKLFPPADRGFGTDADTGSVLLLRSFQDDQAKLFAPISLSGPTDPVIPGGLVRLEELLAFTVMLDGRLVAIGRPGEHLPELGAVRTYYPDDQWQDAVRATANRASVIIVIAALTEGLGWELRHLKEWDLLNKVLVLLPPDVDGMATRQRAEMVFREFDLGELPSSWDNTSWLGFTHEDGRIVHLIVPGRGWSSYAAAVQAVVGSRQGKFSMVPSNEVLYSAATPETSVDLLDEVAVLRDLGRFVKALERKQPDAAEARLRQALERCEAQGPGLLAWVEAAAAEAFADAGDWLRAVQLYEQAAQRCERGFARFRLPSPRELVSSRDLLVEVRRAVAEGDEKHRPEDVWESHRKLFTALEQNHKWLEASGQAEMLARHAPRSEVEVEWLCRAITLADRSGDRAWLACVEQSLGDLFAEDYRGELAREHLRRAEELFESVGQTARAVEVGKTIAAIRPDSVDARRTFAFKRVLSRGVVRARAHHNDAVLPEHVLMGLLEEPQCAALTVLDELGIDPKDLHAIVEGVLPDGANSSGSLSFSPALRRVLASAADRAKQTGRGYVGTEHLLLGLVSAGDTDAARILLQQGVQPEQVREIIAREFDDCETRSPITAEVLMPSGPGASADTLVTSTPVIEALAQGPVILDPRSFFAMSLGSPWLRVPDDQPAPPPGPENALPPDVEKKLLRMLKVQVALHLVGEKGAGEAFEKAGWREGVPGMVYQGQCLQIGKPDGKHRLETERKLRELLASPEPPWFMFDGQVTTGAELKWAVLETLDNSAEDRGDTDERVRIAQEVLALAPRLNPVDGERIATACLAIRLSQAGKYREAEEHYAAARQQGEHDLGFLLNWVANALATNEPAQAAPRWAVLSELSPGDHRFPGFYLVKGDAQWANGDIEAARESYRQGLAEASEFLEDWAARGIFKQRLVQLAQVGSA